MILKQGNTYKLIAIIKDVDISTIEQIIFKFNDIEKEYKSDGTGDVELDVDKFIISLSQFDTLQLTNTVSYEVAVKFTNGEVKRSQTESTGSLETIIDRVV